MTAGDIRQLPVRLPESLYEQLRRAAFETKIPMNQIIVAALKKELNGEKAW